MAVSGGAFCMGLLTAMECGLETLPELGRSYNDWLCVVRKDRQ